MNQELQNLIKDYGKRLALARDDAKLRNFFSLLFNPDETIQVKESKTAHPADALYVTTNGMSDALDSISGRHSTDGYRFCCNPVPAEFMKKLDEIYRYEAVGKGQFARLAEALSDELSLTSDLFLSARTLFIEADKDADGTPLDTIKAKAKALNQILGTGIPVSFIVDTGGNAPHIGIVFDESLSPFAFKETVRLILSRLPSFLDTAVGKINQLGRIPGTYRTNKKGEVVPVTLLYLGSRVSKSAIDEWIKSSPAQNPDVLKHGADSADGSDSDFDIPADTDTEQAAWNFISENGLRNSKSIRHNKIQVSCPNKEKHKSGDRNMSAFINVETGQVWCSACQGTVGQTFKNRRRCSPALRDVLSDLGRKSGMGKLKIKKLF
jgi:hypothetical protein